ncbi:MAG: hypothetical protein IME99_05660 [Proteobacteria bacterium]|nr:hypothetical protein [Pseudomonadota bacterium]
MDISKAIEALRQAVKESVRVAYEQKRLVLFFCFTHLVFLVMGEVMVALEVPGVVSLREEQLKAVQELIYLKPITGVLATSLLLKIAYTLAFNLLFGALVSTTLFGALFFLPYIMAVWRGFLIGMLFYGLDTGAPLKSVIFYGTFLLEFGAYSISSAIGTDLGLTLLTPGRKGVESRGEALKIWYAGAKKLYLLIFILLFFGAVWEIGWLHFLGSIAGPALLLE